MSRMSKSVWLQSVEYQFVHGAYDPDDALILGVHIYDLHSPVEVACRAYELYRERPDKGLYYLLARTNLLSLKVKRAIAQRALDEGWAEDLVFYSAPELAETYLEILDELEMEAEVAR